MSSQNRNLQRTAEQVLMDRVEVDKSVLLERFLKRISEHSKVIERTDISSQDRSWQRTVEQILNDTRHEPTFREQREKECERQVEINERRYESESFEHSLRFFLSLSWPV